VSLYFAYGSNLDADPLRARCAGRRVLDDDDGAHGVTTYVVVEKGCFSPTRECLDKAPRWGAHRRLPDRDLERLRALETAQASV
jgi:hypothetical protein